MCSEMCSQYAGKAAVQIETGDPTFTYFCNTDLSKKSVNMGIRLYNKVPDHIKELENYI
jgi:hypothetical protein